MHPDREARIPPSSPAPWRLGQPRVQVDGSGTLNFLRSRTASPGRGRSVTTRKARSCSIGWSSAPYCSAGRASGFTSSMTISENPAPRAASGAVPDADRGGWCGCCFRRGSCSTRDGTVTFNPDEEVQQRLYFGIREVSRIAQCQGDNAISAGGQSAAAGAAAARAGATRGSLARGGQRPRPANTEEPRLCRRLRLRPAAAGSALLRSRRPSGRSVSRMPTRLTSSGRVHGQPTAARGQREPLRTRSARRSAKGQCAAARGSSPAAAARAASNCQTRTSSKAPTEPICGRFLRAKKSSFPIYPSGLI